MVEVTSIIPLTLGVVFPVLMAIIGVVSSAELRAKIPIGIIVHSIVAIIYCLAALGPNGSTLISENSLVLSSPILGESLAMVFNFGLDKIWWFLGLSSLYLLITMGVSKFSTINGREESEQYVVLLMSYAFACLSLFSKSVLVSCVFFEFWLLVNLFSGLTLVDREGGELMRRTYYTRVFVLTVVFSILFLFNMEGILNTDSTILYSLLFYIGLSILYRPVVHYWTQLLVGSFGLLMASEVFIKALVAMQSKPELSNLSIICPLVAASILSALSVFSNSLARSITMYIASIWLFVISSFASFPELGSPTQILICVSAVLASVMITFIVAMKDLFIRSKVDWLIPLISILLHLIALGAPLTIGSYATYSIFSKGIVFQTIYLISVCMISVSIMRVIMLSKTDPTFWDMKHNLSYREATPWFIPVILVLSNEFFALGGVLGSQQAGGWLGIVDITFQGWEQSKAIYQSSLLVVVTIIGLLLGYLITKKNLRGEWRKFEYNGGTFSLFPGINFSRIERFNFLSSWVPLRFLNLNRNKFSHISSGLGNSLNSFASNAFSNVAWKESAAYLQSFSLFVRYLQNGIVRYYLFYAFLVLSAFVYIYWGMFNE